MKRNLKPTKMKELIIQDGVVYDEGRLSPEFKTKDLARSGGIFG